MVNPSHRPKSRFTNHNTHLSPRPISQTSSRLNAENERPVKKQRLNDGSPQPTTSASLHHTPNTSAPRKAVPRQAAQNSSLTTTPAPSLSTQASSPPAKLEEKRTLRSHDATRRRSELLNFFADFEIITFGPSRVTNSIDQNTPLLISSRPPQSESIWKLDDYIPTPTSAVRPEQPSFRNPKAHTDASPAQANTLARQNQDGRPLFRKIKLPPRRPGQPLTEHDPLSDELYVAAHRRGERKEKQARNWEKERALHEKSELERLLQELKGADWLKTMGILGASEDEAGRYRVARNIFIKRAQGTLDRYAAWNKRDRELKLEREQRLAEEEDNDSSLQDEESERSTDRSSSEEVEKGKGSKPRSKLVEQLKSQQQQPVQEEPFTSFFKKPHMREAAMKSHRRGRNILAFGLPIPALPDQAEFRLPEVIAASGATASKQK